MYANGKKCRVVTLELKEVCILAWRHIMGVPKTTSYRLAGYVAKD
jgi:hypothetical protein